MILKSTFYSYSLAYYVSVYVNKSKQNHPPNKHLSVKTLKENMLQIQKNAVEYYKTLCFVYPQYD